MNVQALHRIIMCKHTGRVDIVITGGRDGDDPPDWYVDCRKCGETLDSGSAWDDIPEKWIKRDIDE